MEDFGRSTQARNWIFNEESLEACRKLATLVKRSEDPAASVKEMRAGPPSPRKFASGFHRSYEASVASETLPCTTRPRLSSNEQELLVRFHAHQIQSLIGPTALLPGLQTIEAVTLTAITLLRRFYLSNSVAEIHPRHIAVASVFLASKVEEDRVEIGLLAHATVVVNSMVLNAPLCREELCVVSIRDIEIHERILMEGLNYEFRCHHPTEMLSELTTKMASLLSSDGADDDRDPVDCGHSHSGSSSPRGALDYLNTFQSAGSSLEQALEVSHLATIFSDVLFLFGPDHAAVAITAIVHGTFCDERRMNGRMHSCVQSAFPALADEQLEDFVYKSNGALQMLLRCPFIDLRPSSRLSASNHDVVAKRAEALRSVLGKVAHLRMLGQIRFRELSFLSAPYSNNYYSYRSDTTRKRSLECHFPEHSTPYPCLRPRSSRRICRVTPTAFSR